MNKEERIRRRLTGMVTFTDEFGNKTVVDLDDDESGECFTPEEWEKINPGTVRSSDEVRKFYSNLEDSYKDEVQD